MKGLDARLFISFALALSQASGCSSAPPARVFWSSPPAPVVAVSAAPVSSSAPQPKSPEVDAYAISTENEAALAVAAEILDRGGNAVDAAVAGVMAAGVAQPSSTGLGGDGFAVVWDAAQKTAFTVDFRATAPKGLRRKEHLSRTPPKKKWGVMVGVPGVVAGLFEMHRRAGKLPWADVVRVAADVADHGFVVSPYLGEALGWMAHDKDVDPTFSIGFGDDGIAESSRHSVSAGSTLKNPPLAETLRAIADGGSKAFYSGDLARDVVDSARRAGSALSLGDLSSYQAIVRPPLRVDWEGFRVLTVPPPSAGGVALGEMLGLFSKRDLQSLNDGSAVWVHMLSEGLRVTLVDRQLNVGDPAFTKVDAALLLDRTRLAEKRGQFRKDATVLPKLRSIAEGGTYHFSVIDRDGGAVSITTTLTDLFGAKVLTKAGFPLNDALVDFAMDEYGQRAQNRGPNFPRGGARPASSLTPTIVVKDGVVEMALGASGGLRAPSSVFEVMVARLAFDKSLDESVTRPRFFVPSSGALLLDAGLSGLASDLRSRGEIVDAARPDFGAVSAVEERREKGARHLDAAADPRKHGVALVGKNRSDAATAPAKEEPRSSSKND